MARIFSLIILVIFASSCASHDVVRTEFSSSFSQAVPVCELLSHPKKYLGSEISVGGLYGSTPHQRILYDPSCKTGELAVQLSEDGHGLRADHKMMMLLKAGNGDGIKSIYHGFIVSDPVIGGCSDDACFRYTMKNAQLLKADVVGLR